MSDLPKVKNYEVKIRIKTHDLQEREREREGEADRINSLQGRLIIPNFSYLNCCTVARFIYSIYHLAKKPNIFCANNLWNVNEVIRKSMLESKR